MNVPVRLGVLISGSGRTLQNLIDRIGDGTLPARIEIVVSSQPGVAGLDRAARAGIPTATVPWRGSRAEQDFSRDVTKVLDRQPLDLVVMAGFLRRWRFPVRYEGRVLNIHPALLPKFGGRGYYGRRVHEAVLAAGEAESGCTVHIADLEYDRGPLILQERVPVLAGDTTETLADRVFQAECRAYPEAIRRVAAGRTAAAARTP